MKWIKYTDKPYPRDREVAVKWGTYYSRSFDLDDPRAFGKGDTDYLIHNLTANHVPKESIYWLDESRTEDFTYEELEERYVTLGEAYEKLKYSKRGTMLINVPVGSYIIPPGKITKEEQRQLLKEIMEADAKDGLYDKEV